MNSTLAKLLSEAIDNYNDYADEYEQLYWWDILNELTDMTDDEEVIRVIIGIEKTTERLIIKEAAGL